MSPGWFDTDIAVLFLNRRESTANIIRFNDKIMNHIIAMGFDELQKI